MIRSLISDFRQKYQPMRSMKIACHSYLGIAVLFALVACVANHSYAQTTVVENHFLNQQTAQEATQVSHTVPCESCTTGCDLGCNTCVNPYPSPLQVGPYQQAIGLRGCNCESCIRGIDCANSGGKEQRWRDTETITFQPLGHGEWIGPVRLPSMLQYRVRVGDELNFIFVKVHEQRPVPYRLLVGDELAITSVVDDRVKIGDTVKGIQIQPDGKLYPYLIPPVQAAGLTIDELRKSLEQEYSKYIRNPAINVLPVRTNTKLEDLNIAVSNFQVNGGQNVSAIVGPDGRIQLPLIGNIRVIGMTTEEIKREINLLYANRDYWGVEIEPRLIKQASHFVFVTGEVRRPGRVELLGPTTVMQAVAMAEGIQVGGNMRQVVIFRRGEDWRLLATMVDIRGAMLAKRPNPADEIWVRDGDLIIVPPQPIKVFDNWVKLVFTDGIYGVAPAVLFSDNN